MNHYKLVLPEHLNNQGSLFGGYLLKWIDEVSYISANLDLPGNRFVTIALNNVVFKHKIDCGQILCFSVKRSKLGNSSVEYKVKVYGDEEPKDDSHIFFETAITFVNTDQEGNKAQVNQKDQC